MNQDSNIFVYELEPTDKFNDDMEYYIKKRKFRNIGKDISDILNDLKLGIFHGDVIGDLKLECDSKTYKIRAVNSDTKQGKSNGYRLIYYVENEDKIVFLVTIYYKKDDIRIPSDSEITKIIKKYCF